jgi:ribosomal RNA-processing protein 12
MFALQQKAELEGRQSEAKVWSVLIAQIWAGLASYCAASPELPKVGVFSVQFKPWLTSLKSFPLAFSELLSQLLYTQTELRPSILKALKVVVESNVALASHDGGGTEPLSVTSNLSPEEASANIDFLRTQAESWLAVFFNLFTSINPDSRGMVGDVIKAWASITSQQVRTHLRAITTPLKIA